jgi:hypothetical protein
MVAKVKTQWRRRVSHSAEFQRFLLSPSKASTSEDGGELSTTATSLPMWHEDHRRASVTGGGMGRSGRLGRSGRSKDWQASAVAPIEEETTEGEVRGCELGGA